MVGSFGLFGSISNSLGYQIDADSFLFFSQSSFPGWNLGVVSAFSNFCMGLSLALIVTVASLYMHATANPLAKDRIHMVNSWEGVSLMCGIATYAAEGNRIWLIRFQFLLFGRV